MFSLALATKIFLGRNDFLVTIFSSVAKNIDIILLMHSTRTAVH